MTINIPHAGGLVSELEERIKGVLTVSEPKTQMMGPKFKKTSIDIAVDGTYLGGVDCVTCDVPEGTRVLGVSYFGKMPGYVNAITDNEYIAMLADESFGVRKGPNKHLASEQEIPNDTAEHPLYRQDKHQLKLADHEVEGQFRKGDRQPGGSVGYMSILKSKHK